MMGEEVALLKFFTGFVPGLNNLATSNPYIFALTIVIVLAIYLNFFSNRQLKMSDEIRAIKDTKFESKMEYVEEILDSIEMICVTKVIEIVNEVHKVDGVDNICGTYSQCLVGKMSADAEILNYRLVFVDLKNVLKHRIKSAIRKNGFHKKKGRDLNEYVVSLTNSLLIKGQHKAKTHDDSYPSVKGMDWVIMPRDIAFDHIKKIIDKCIVIHKEELEEIREIRAKYSKLEAVKNKFSKS